MGTRQQQGCPFGSWLATSSRAGGSVDYRCLESEQWMARAGRRGERQGALVRAHPVPLQCCVRGAAGAPPRRLHQGALLPQRKVRRRSEVRASAPLSPHISWASIFETTYLQTYTIHTNFKFFGFQVFHVTLDTLRYLFCYCALCMAWGTMTRRERAGGAGAAAAGDGEGQGGRGARDAGEAGETAAPREPVAAAAGGRLGLPDAVAEAQDAGHAGVPLQRLPVRSARCASRVASPACDCSPHCMGRLYCLWWSTGFRMGLWF